MKLTKDEQTAVTAATIVPLQETERYVVVGPYCYGYGKTVPEALKNAKSNRVKIYEGTAGWRFMLFAAHENVHVEDVFGGFTWDPTVTGEGQPYRELYRSQRFRRGVAK